MFFMFIAASKVFKLCLFSDGGMSTFRVMEEEKRKTLKEQQKFNQQHEQYKDRVKRKRHDDQLGQWGEVLVFYRKLFKLKLFKLNFSN